MSISTTNTMTRKERVYNYLKKNRKYVPGHAITDPAIGGTEGLRRLRELRADGEKILKRRNPKTGQWEYKLDR